MLEDGGGIGADFADDVVCREGEGEEEEEERAKDKAGQDQ